MTNPPNIAASDALRASLRMRPQQRLAVRAAIEATAANRVASPFAPPRQREHASRSEMEARHQRLMRIEAQHELGLTDDAPAEIIDDGASLDV